MRVKSLSPNNLTHYNFSAIRNSSTIYIHLHYQRATRSSYSVPFPLTMLFFYFSFFLFCIRSPKWYVWTFAYACNGLFNVCKSYLHPSGNWAHFYQYLDMTSLIGLLLQCMLDYPRPIVRAYSNGNKQRFRVSKRVTFSNVESVQRKAFKRGYTRTVWNA